MTGTVCTKANDMLEKIYVPKTIMSIFFANRRNVEHRFCFRLVQCHTNDIPPFRGSRAASSPVFRGIVNTSFHLRLLVGAAKTSTRLGLLERLARGSSLRRRSACTSWLQ